MPLQMEICDVFTDTYVIEQTLYYLFDGKNQFVDNSLSQTKPQISGSFLDIEVKI